MGSKSPGSEKKRRTRKDSVYPGLPQNAEHESPGGSPKKEKKTKRTKKTTKESYHTPKDDNHTPKMKKTPRPHSDRKVSQLKLKFTVQGLTFTAKSAFR